MDAARLVGAIYHESLVNDLEIFYERDTLRRLAAVVRDVAPEIILTQSTQEYMEDHMNTTRLVLTAAFARGMPNFAVDPAHADHRSAGDGVSRAALRPARSAAPAHPAGAVRRHRRRPAAEASDAGDASQPEGVAGCEPGPRFVPDDDGRDGSRRSADSRARLSTPRGGRAICTWATAPPMPIRSSGRWAATLWSPRRLRIAWGELPGTSKMAADAR